VVIIFLALTSHVASFLLKAELYEDPNSERESIAEERKPGLSVLQNRPKRQVRVITRDQFSGQPQQFQVAQVNQQGDAGKYWQGVAPPLMFGQPAQGTKDNYWSGGAEPVQFPIAQNAYAQKASDGSKIYYPQQMYPVQPLQPQFGAPFGNPQWQPVPNFGG